MRNPFTGPGVDLVATLGKAGARKLWRADIDTYDQQIGRLSSLIRTTEAQIATLEAYRRDVSRKLDELGDEYDDE